MAAASGRQNKNLWPQIRNEFVITSFASMIYVECYFINLKVGANFSLHRWTNDNTLERQQTYLLRTLHTLSLSLSLTQRQCQLASKCLDNSTFDCASYDDVQMLKNEITRFQGIELVQIIFASESYVSTLLLRNVQRWSLNMDGQQWRQQHFVALFNSPS